MMKNLFSSGVRVIYLVKMSFLAGSSGDLKCVHLLGCLKNHAFIKLYPKILTKLSTLYYNNLLASIEFRCKKHL